MLSLRRATTDTLARLVITVLASGCGADDPTACTTERDANGHLTIDLGTVCVRDVEVSVLRRGVWESSVDDPHVDLISGADGSVSVELSTQGEAAAFRIDVPAIRGDRLLQQGFQSWSFSGAVVAPNQVERHADGAPRFAAAASGEVLDETAGVSYGAITIGGESGDFVTVGATSARHASTGLAAWGPGQGTRPLALTVVYGAAREPLVPGADGRTRSEPIHWSATSSPEDGLARLAAATQAALPAGTRSPRRPPGGWFSWNERFDEIDQAYVRAHIAKVADTLAPAGLPAVVIDDGWMEAWGDWRENAKFADGLGALAAEADARGLTAGVWLAPFVVDADSALAASLAPTAFVRDAGGEPIVIAPLGTSRRLLVLDGSDEEAFSTATAAITRLYAAGFRVFKLDYLYAGALPGMRRHATTGTAALRHGLELLRAATGPDAIFSGCGVPISPVLGLVDSLRVGPDTAFGAVDLAWPMVTSAARSLAARAHLAPLVWLDADQVQVRARYTVDEARMAAVAAALAGPAYGLGDDLTTLSTERLMLALAPDVLDLAGGAGGPVPLDLLAHPAEDVVVSPLLEAPVDPVAPPPSVFEATGASGTRYRVTFAWSTPRSVTVEH
ncbi:MAG: alpha-galactosidase [Kofleriaceae bacterium]|nr:alpha-galactosidase [Kofleriaceae bacterium]